MIPLLIAQRKVASMWYIFGALILLLIIVQSVGGKYSSDYLKVIGWYSKNILPTLLVLSTTMIFAARNEHSIKDKHISMYFAKIIKAASWFYFVVILLFFLAQPIVYSRMGKSALETLEMSTPFLGVIQGFINALIGAITIDVKTDHKGQDKQHDKSTQV
jgi:hypothetical protein